MQNVQLINLELSHNQSTFRHGSVVGTTVIMEFSLQARTPSTMSDKANSVVH